ncbi:MAG TPA: hypothetical protein VHP34_00090 [Alphaproteobacteria bacterium]|nr:hypothetical protein [Alphaproteobacteria bacterium]
MTDNSQNNTPNDDDMLSQSDARKFERNVAIVGVIFFAVFCAGLWIVMKNVADGPLPPPSFVPTGDIATQSEIHAPKIHLPESNTRENRVEYAVPPDSVIDVPQESDIDGAPPQPVFQPADTLQLKNPRHAYDLPVGPYDSDPKWRTVRGIVTAIAPRTDRMTDGSQRKNLYARTEFYIKDSNMNCFFHQYMGETATLQVNDYVLVQYDPKASDACGSSHIVK